MNDEKSKDIDYERLKFEREKEDYWRLRKQTDRRDQMYIHGVRALFLLNGGGSVALLAFLGQVWSQTNDVPEGIIDGMTYLVWGCAITGILHFIRYYTSLYWTKKSEIPIGTFKYVVRVGPYLAILSGVLAAVSLSFFVWGLSLVIDGAQSKFVGPNEVIQSSTECS